MPHSNWDELAELALKRVAASGAEYGDIRLVRSTSQSVNGEDRRIASIRDVDDTGFGVRVLYQAGGGSPPVQFFPLKKFPALLSWPSTSRGDQPRSRARKSGWSTSRSITTVW